MVSQARGVASVRCRAPCSGAQGCTLTFLGHRRPYLIVHMLHSANYTIQANFVLLRRAPLSQTLLYPLLAGITFSNTYNSSFC